MLTIMVGWGMLVSSLASQVMGLPQQIIKNFRRRSVEGLSILFFTAGVSSYITATWWAILERQWLLAASRLPGALFTSVIVGQALYYNLQSREPKELSEEEAYREAAERLLEEEFPNCRFVTGAQEAAWTEISKADYISRCFEEHRYRAFEPSRIPTSFMSDEDMYVIIPADRDLPYHEPYIELVFSLA